VSRAVATRSSNVLLEGIHLELSERSLLLTGFDSETAIRCALALDGGEEGKVVMPRDTFLDILRKLPGDEMAVEADGDKVRITSENADYVVIGMLADGYPALDFSGNQLTATLPQGTLRSMIAQTVFSVSSSEARPVHTGCKFCVESTMIEVVGVDGYRLALRREPYQGEEEPCSFVVPGRALLEMARTLTDSDTPVYIYAGEKAVLFTTENVTFLTRTLEGEFLNYRASIPAESAMRAIVNTKAFAECVERASLLISERQRSPVRIVFSDGEAQISCYTPIGKFDDRMPIEFKCSEPIEMGFNVRFLLDVMRHVGDSDVAFEMSNSSSPLVIRPKEGDHYVYLVLPVRLRTDA